MLYTVVVGCAVYRYIVCVDASAAARFFPVLAELLN